MVDVSICCITHRPNWMPWTLYQISKQVVYLREKNLIVQILVLCHNFPEGLVKNLKKLPSPFPYQFIEVNGNQTIGELRNMASDLSHGEYVAFMDSDDWYLASRIHRQWRSLEFQASHRKYDDSVGGNIIKLDQFSICTVGQYPVIDLLTGRSYYANHISESCLMFKKDFFDGPNGSNRFEHLRTGEANAFIEGQKVLIIDDCVLMIALDHGNNSCPRLQACEGTSELLLLLDENEKMLLRQMGFLKFKLSQLKKEE